MKCDSTWSFILHAEVKPLTMALSVGVNSQIEIILVVFNPGIQKKVPRWPGSDCHFQTDYRTQFHADFSDPFFSQ